MDISERIKLIINHYKITSAEFANKVAVQKSSISHLLSGRNKPSFDFINKLAIAFEEISIEWFITGKGSMLVTTLDKELDDSKNVQISIPETSVGQIDNSSNNSGVSESFNDSVNSKTETGNNHPESMILIYNDDTFKILKSR